MGGDRVKKRLSPTVADRSSAKLTPEERAILEVSMERIRQRRAFEEKVYRRGPRRDLQLRTLGELFGPVLLSLRSASALESTWRRVVGDLLARHSRPLRWDDAGTSLVVACDTEDWRRVLSEERVELVRKLSAELRSKVAALVFVADGAEEGPAGES